MMPFRPAASSSQATALIKCTLVTFSPRELNFFV